MFVVCREASSVVTRRRAAMRAYLVRHAQSENNVPARARAGQRRAKRRPRGHGEGLPTGWMRSRRVSRDCAPRRREGSRCTASPMRRCLLTANAMARGMRTRAKVMIDAHEHGGCFRGARGRDADADGTSRAIGERGMTRDEIESEFELVDASDVPTIGWWDASRGCETVAEAQTRAARGVARYLMHKARAMAAGEEEEMDVCIVTHGMFIDMLLKTLFDVPRTRGKAGGAVLLAKRVRARTSSRHRRRRRFGGIAGV